MKFTSIFFTASAVYLRDLSQMYKFYKMIMRYYT